jgi:hypothetical protein
MERKRVHGAAESVEPVWHHQRLDGPFAGLMEKIMSKSNDTTKTRELTEAELSAVSGGSKDDTPVETISFNFRLAPAPFSIDIGTSENLVARRS